MKILCTCISFMLLLECFPQGGVDIKYIKTAEINETHKHIPVQIDFASGRPFNLRSSTSMADTIRFPLWGDTVTLIEVRKRYVDSWLLRDQYVKCNDLTDSTSGIFFPSEILEIATDKIRFSIDIAIYDKEYKMTFVTINDELWIDKKLLDGIMIQLLPVSPAR